MTSNTNDRAPPDLLKVLEISRAMVAAADLDSLLQLIIDRSMELLDAERASLFLYDRQREELYSRVATGVDEIRFPADRGLAGAAIQTGKVLNVDDAYADPRFNQDVDRRTGFRTRNILSVPLPDYEGGLVGVLQVLNQRAGLFRPGDITIAETFAAQAGVAIQRATLIQHYVEKLEMQRAMSIARDIQHGLFPREKPDIDGFDIAGFSKPADETGGDTYDYMPLGDGRWMLALADASGHGIGPALVIAETRAMLRAMSLHSDDVPAVLGTVNNLLANDLASERFVTCFFGLLEPEASTLVYASAGHGPLLFYDRRDDTFREVAATGLPLGIIEDFKYDHVETVVLESGDLGIFTTDGFFEAAGADGEQFGIERMKEILRRDRDLPAEKMIANLHDAVIQFVGDQPQADDLTAIIVRRL